MGTLETLQHLRLRTEVVRIARGNLGYGEEDANNDGRLIRTIGGKPGAEWCALFAGYTYRKAWETVFGEPATWCWKPWADAGDYAAQTDLRIGAKELIKAAWAAGAERFTDPNLARPGDLVCWHRRTGPISWQGHIGVVELYLSQHPGLIQTIEGNVGRFPSKVKQLVHDVTKERLYGFAGFR
jgi:hypothetical protein